MDPVSMAAVGGAYALNNVISEVHASNQAKRDAALMRQQNALNKSNILGAYADKVAGLKMAGLNPALAADGSTPAVATASKASAGMAENVELDPASLLLKAQADNLNADTRKKNAEVGNVNEDTELKYAQKLFTGANQSKIEEETQNIKNINDTYSSQNRYLKDIGRGMAEKWQASSWYNSLAPQTKDTIDAIASGESPLTVGGMNALKSVIESQEKLSDADRKLIQNAFDNAVTEAMFNDQAVMDSIAQAPKNQQDLLKRQAEKIKAELPKIRAEIANLAADTKLKNLTAQDLTNRIKAYINTDLDYLRADNYEKGGDAQSTVKYWIEWFKGQVEHLIPMVGSAYVGGRAFGSGVNKSKPSTPSDDGPGYTTVPPRWTPEGRSAGAFRGPVPDNTTVHDMSTGVHEVDFSRGRGRRSRSK